MVYLIKLHMIHSRLCVHINFFTIYQLSHKLHIYIYSYFLSLNPFKSTRRFLIYMQSMNKVLRTGVVFFFLVADKRTAANCCETLLRLDCC